MSKKMIYLALAAVAVLLVMKKSAAASADAYTIPADMGINNPSLGW